MRIKKVFPGWLIGILLVVSKKFFTTEKTKERVEADSVETNKMLGLSFQQQGMLDLAMEKDPEKRYQKAGQLAEHKSIGLIGPFDESSPLIKNILTRVLGLTEKVNVFISPIRPEAGDLLLMCSDGLTNYVPQASIKTILGDFSISLERKAQVLIDEANRGGGGDNITVILLEVVKEGVWGRFKRKLKTGNPA